MFAYIKSRKYLTNTFKTDTIKNSRKLENIKILSLQPNPDRSFNVRHETWTTIGSSASRTRRSFNKDTI